MNFILQIFRLALWFYCLVGICFLVGHLLNKIHVVFDAFNSSCCSYVHKKIQKTTKKKKQREKKFSKKKRGFQKKNLKKKKKKERKIFWIRGIGPSSHFNSFSKKIDRGHWAFFSNLFLKTLFVLSKTPRFFESLPFNDSKIFFFFSREYKMIHLTKLLPNHDD